MSQADPLSNNKPPLRTSSPSDDDRPRNLLVASLALAAAMVFTSVSAFVFSPSDLISGKVAAAIPGVIGLTALVSAWLCQRKRVTGAAYLLIASLLGGILVETLLTTGYGLLLGVAVFVGVSAVAALGLHPSQATRMVLIAMVVGITALLLDMFGPEGRRAGSEFFRSLAPIPIFFFLTVYIILTARLFPTYSLRAKLIISMVGIAVVFTSMLTGFNNYSASQSLNQAASRMLFTAAQQTAHVVDHYLEELRETLESDATSDPVTSFLVRSAQGSLSREEQQDALSELKFLVSKSQADQYFLLDRQGTVVLHSGGGVTRSYPRYLELNNIEDNRFDLLLLVGGTYISPILFPDDPQNAQEPYFYVATRVLNTNEEPIGLLAGRYPAYALQELISQESSLAGGDSFAVLLDENYLRLAHGSIPELLYRLVTPLEDEKVADYQQRHLLPSASLLSTDLPAFAAGLKNSAQQPYFTTSETALANATAPILYSAAATSLSSQPWYVVYMQAQSVFLAPVERQTNNNILLALAIAAGTSLAAIGIAQVISRPLVRLTQTAEHISAGHLDEQAEVRSQDEIGKLAMAFNTMTAQLRHTMEGLEQRVAERTTELEAASATMQQRATQLQMVADIAHTIASIQDMEKLLTVVPQQISKRFGFYHVGIFLLDKSGEHALLQGANSEGGQRMLAHGHRLRVGQTGIVGFVTANRQPRIALDVGRDAVYFDNPDLPLTRSEIALPLEVGDQILGALDVQSTQPAAFNNDDVALLSTLANQVAVAIQNTRLFSETRQTLTELQIAQRQYLQREWNRLVKERQIHGIEYQLGNLRELRAGLQVDWPALQDGGISAKPAFAEAPLSQASDPGSLMVPLMLRGQVIGALRLESEGGRLSWSDEEITLIRSVADQVSLALENARLIQETSQRAEREHVLSAITSKVRASTNVDDILQIAIQELTQALNVSAGTIQLQGKNSDPAVSNGE